MSEKSEPVVAERSPVGVELEAGQKYWWCACGRSANQPFCDGSHKGTGITPMKLEVEKDGRYFLCRCKQSGNQPYCDGSHNKLE